MTFAALQPLAERASIFAALQQEVLRVATESLGEHRWDMDMPSKTLTFSAVQNPTTNFTAQAHLIASLAPGPRSLLWGWSHPQGEPDGVAAQLRAYGEQHGIESLTAAELPFPDEAGENLDEWIASAAHQIGTLAIEITGRAPYYSAPIGGGSRAVFVLDTHLPRPTVRDAVAQLPHVLQSLPLSDARTAIWDTARLAGWHLEWADAAYSGAIVSDATGRATVRFDESARIAGIDAQLEGHPGAAPVAPAEAPVASAEGAAVYAEGAAASGQPQAAYGDAAAAYGEPQAAFGEAQATFGETPSANGEPQAAFGEAQAMHGEAHAAPSEGATPYGEAAAASAEAPAWPAEAQAAPADAAPTFAEAQAVPGEDAATPAEPQAPLLPRPEAPA